MIYSQIVLPFWTNQSMGQAHCCTVFAGNFNNPYGSKSLFFYLIKTRCKAISNKYREYNFQYSLKMQVSLSANFCSILNNSCWHLLALKKISSEAVFITSIKTINKTYHNPLLFFSNIWKVCSLISYFLHCFVPTHCHCIVNKKKEIWSTYISLI